MPKPAWPGPRCVPPCPRWAHGWAHVTTVEILPVAPVLSPRAASLLLKILREASTSMGMVGNPTPDPRSLNSDSEELAL